MSDRDNFTLETLRRLLAEAEKINKDSLAYAKSVRKQAYRANNYTHKGLIEIVAGARKTARQARRRAAALRDLIAWREEGEQ